MAEAHTKHNRTGGGVLRSELEGFDGLVISRA
jgi:hypothetical protein